jgi:anti-sigma regulatory factor (Ser/Thr protein kinase)
MMDGSINAAADTFPARGSELRRIGTFLNDFCSRHGIGRERCLRINLVVEELFTNTVCHGHRGDSDAPVWVSVATAPEAVYVTYEDTAPPFNPYAFFAGAPPDVTAPLQKIGGLGVLLTRELAATRDYAYLFGRNRIRLTLKQ